MLAITNLTSNSIEEDFFERITENVLEAESKEGTVSLVFLGPQRIKNLNKKYRKKNKITDVLSFSNIPKDKDFVTSPFAQKQLGEIFICLREVRKKARRQKLIFNEELARTFIHGLLHLSGYSHQKDEDRKIMESRENQYFNLFF